MYKTNNADIKYCPSVYSKVDGEDVFTPALLAFTRRSNGEINHVQVTKLDIKTANKSALFENCKQTFGKTNGIAVNLNHKGEGDITFLTEGVETGLSILEVSPKARVLTVLGKENFASVNAEQLTKHVVICVDNDGESTFKYQKNHTNKILVSIKRMQEYGITTALHIPKNKGEDLNDILLHYGKNALSEAIKSTITAQKYKEICDIENAYVPEITADTSKYQHNKLAQEPKLSTNIQENNLIKSNLIDQLKSVSKNQIIKEYSSKKSAVVHDKASNIPQKEMDREL